MEISSAKECSICHFPKGIDDFKKHKVKGKIYVTNICKKCHNRKRTLRYKKTPRSRSRMDRMNERARERRASLERQEHWMCFDTKRSDKKKGLIYDLDENFVRELIKDGCSYCGDNSVRMTVDRIDNSIGHIRANVNAACIRCNYMRRDMPYQAWLEIVPLVKQARLKGLFGEWIGCNALRKNVTFRMQISVEEYKALPPQLLSMTKDKAVELLKSKECHFGISVEDGKSFILPQIVMIRLEIEKGIVVRTELDGNQYCL